MYQSPDFVKVDLDIKDNFAAYVSCSRISGTNFIISDETFPDGGCNTVQTVSYRNTVSDYQCYLTPDAP